MTDGQRWLSAHLYYHDELDRVLTEVLAPVVRELRTEQLAEEWFFLRYWEGGNHVRLRVLPAPGADEARIRGLITERAGEFFDRHAARSTMSEREYAGVARRLAAGEQRDGYAAALRPNNTVEFVPYHREHDRFGGDESIREVERQFGAASKLALALLSAGASANQRSTVCYAALLSCWLAAEPDPAALGGWTSGLFTTWSQGTEVDTAEFDRRYAGTRGSLLALAGRVHGLLREPAADTADGGLAAWANSVLRLRDTLAAQVAAGADTLPDRGWGEGTPTPLRTKILPILDICAHLFCNRMGVPTTEERYLRYLAGRIVTELPEAAA